MYTAGCCTFHECTLTTLLTQAHFLVEHLMCIHKGETEDASFLFDEESLVTRQANKVKDLDRIPAFSFSEAFLAY